MRRILRTEGNPLFCFRDVIAILTSYNVNTRETNYLKDQIVSLFKVIDAAYFEYQILADTNYVEEASENLPFIHTCIQQAHRCICVFLEVESLGSYLKSFKEKFDRRVEDFGEITVSIDLPEDVDGPVLLPIASDMKSFLYPFMSFANNKNGKDSYDKVVNVLKSTAQIVSKIRVFNLSEASIYNEVLWVLHFYFDARRGSPVGSRGKFGIYRPDLLIPELSTAIEYKYVREKALLNPYLDGLIADATNYKGDSEYNQFIAVVCFEKLLFSEESIRQAWSEKQFPSNWELIVVRM